MIARDQAIVGSHARARARGTDAVADGVLEAIGATPLVALRRLVDRPDLEVWGKLEASNPGGSIKDRPAVEMVERALADGSLRPGSTVVESSSGNMALGLAQACRYHGLGLVCVVDSRADRSKVSTLRAFGAEVRTVTEPDPETGDLLTARLRLARELVDSIPGAFWPDQYANPANPAAHAEGTMREIDEALEGALDFLFVATSTTGTLRGCIDYLRGHARETTVIAVDAVGSALFGARAGPRALPGLGAGVETELSRHAHPDRTMRMSDADCVRGCRTLVDREAIFAGASSGAVASACIALAPSLPDASRCALILPDGGAGYLDTIYDEDWVRREVGVVAGR